MTTNKTNSSPAPVPALSSGIGFAAGAIVANSIANTPTGGFTLKHGVKKIVFDPSGPSITCDDGAGNTVFIGGSNPAVQLNDVAGNSNNQNADQIGVTDASGASVLLQPASSQILVSNAVGQTVVVQPNEVILAGTTSGNLELRAPDVAGANNQIFLAATGTPPVQVLAPLSSTAPGVAGSIAFDSNYFYACIATNTWVRAALTTF